MAKFTRAEDDFLRENFKKMTIEEMGATMHRSRNALSLRCEQLGLKRDSKESGQNLRRTLTLEKFFDKAIQKMYGGER